MRCEDVCKWEASRTGVSESQSRIFAWDKKRLSLSANTKRHTLGSKATFQNCEGSHQAAAGGTALAREERQHHERLVVDRWAAQLKDGMTDLSWQPNRDDIQTEHECERIAVVVLGQLVGTWALFVDQIR